MLHTTVRRLTCTWRITDAVASSLSRSLARSLARWLARALKLSELVTQSLTHSLVQLLCAAFCILLTSSAIVKAVNLKLATNSFHTCKLATTTTAMVCLSLSVPLLDCPVLYANCAFAFCSDPIQMLSAAVQVKKRDGARQELTERQNEWASRRERD